MTLNDAGIIAKKIGVGFILVLIPFLILWVGVKLTQKALTPENETTQTISFTK